MQSRQTQLKTAKMAFVLLPISFGNSSPLPGPPWTHSAVGRYGWHRNWGEMSHGCHIGDRESVTGNSLLSGKQPAKVWIATPGDKSMRLSLSTRGPSKYQAEWKEPVPKVYIHTIPIIYMTFWKRDRNQISIYQVLGLGNLKEHVGLLRW